MTREELALVIEQARAVRLNLLRLAAALGGNDSDQPRAVSSARSAAMHLDALRHELEHMAGEPAGD